MRLEELHPDMGRYLQEDCYCPGEIYSPDGFFFKVYTVDDLCTVIDSTESISAVVLYTHQGGEKDEKPQAAIFWHDEGDGQIINAQRVDATENNIAILRAIVRDEDTDGMKLDEFEPGSMQESLKKVFEICDAVIVD